MSYVWRSSSPASNWDDPDPFDWEAASASDLQSSARAGISYLTGEAVAIPSRLSEAGAERLIFWSAVGNKTESPFGCLVQSDDLAPPVEVESQSKGRKLSAR